jgi:hypothetical protein
MQPDSLVSSHVYEIMKTIYSTPASESSDETRISVLQNTLSQLRLANIATLDALMTHFTRLIELTSADESYIAALATALAPCILRPRTETSMTMEEKYSYRLIRDLFAHKVAIFSELKRASSLTHSISVDTRPRAISTDESNRKANFEARQRAVIAASGHSGGSRSRAPSPAPSPRGHRRDKSSGGPETRFPVQTSPTNARENKSVVRHSLEVPGDAVVPPSEPASVSSSAPLQNITNGSSDTPASATYMPGMDDGMMSEAISSEKNGVEKRNSLGRAPAAAGGRFGGRKPVALRMGQTHDQSKRDSVGSMTSYDDGIGEKFGVTLTDKPMDD